MDMNQLAATLSTLPQTDRDLAERIITNPTSVSQYSPGFDGDRVIRESDPVTGASLKRLRENGIINRLEGRWCYVAGPVSDFFAIRQATNFS